MAHARPASGTRSPPQSTTSDVHALRCVARAISATSPMTQHLSPRASLKLTEVQTLIAAGRVHVLCCPSQSKECSCVLEETGQPRRRGACASLVLRLRAAFPLPTNRAGDAPTRATLVTAMGTGVLCLSLCPPDTLNCTCATDPVCVTGGVASLDLLRGRPAPAQGALRAFPNATTSSSRMNNRVPNQ